MQSIFLVNDWRNSFLTINTLTSDWHTLTYLESGNEYFFFQKTFTWSEYLNSIMIFDGKLHEMITITFLKKMTQLSGKYPLKILEFRDQINLVDAITTTVLQIGKDFYLRFYERSTFNVEINTHCATAWLVCRFYKVF